MEELLELDRNDGGEAREKQNDGNGTRLGFNDMGNSRVGLEYQEKHSTTRTTKPRGNKRTNTTINNLLHPVLLGLIVLLSVFSLGTCLKCYHCLERPKSTEKHLACAYFDKSDKFHKECTHSSFCMKRTSQFQLHNGSYVTIHVHKCADQSHKTMIQDTNGDWKWAQLFKHDLYNEGCFPHNTQSMLTTDSYHCFCSTDFCNGANNFTKNPFLTVLMLLGLVLVYF